MKARIQHVLKTYGKTAAVFHGSVFAATLSGCSAAIHYGVDLKPALQHIPFVDLSDMDPKAGTLALAYLSTLATGAFVLVHTAAAVDVRKQTDSRAHSFMCAASPLQVLLAERSRSRPFLRSRDYSRACGPCASDWGKTTRERGSQLSM